MIFVTVGTHEQQFNRLIKKIDELKGKGLINDKVIIQSGYSNYDIKYCENYRLIGYDKMHYYAQNSEIMITHGGPASIFLALQYGKKPIVVPRQKKFNEHIDDHQVLFCNYLKKEDKIILVDEIDELIEQINLLKAQDYSNFEYESNTEKFVRKFEDEINLLFS